MEVLHVALFHAAADFPMLGRGLQNAKQLFRVSKVLAWQFVKYIRSIHVADDTKVAIFIGGLVGLATLLFLAYNPGDAYDYSASKVGAEVTSGKKKKKAKKKTIDRVLCSDLSGDVASGNTACSSPNKEPEALEDVVLGTGVKGRVDEKAAVFLKGLVNMTNEIMETRSKGPDFDVALAISDTCGGVPKVNANTNGQEAGPTSSFSSEDDDDNGSEKKQKKPKNATFVDPFENPKVTISLNCLVQTLLASFSGRF